MNGNVNSGNLYQSNTQQTLPAANQSMDYDSWVSSLANIQEGILQNTPITSQIFQNSSLNSGVHILQQQDLDPVYDSPERFYRDVINESPIISRTPQVGRTPLRNLSFNFSTPNFLKNIETSHLFGSATRGLTPLKSQQFGPQDMFQTPHISKICSGGNSGSDTQKSSKNIQNGSTLNSSPTTIKMGSSAVKADADQGSTKILPPSPTPASKASSSFNAPEITNASVPKMGRFTKTPEPEKKRPAPKATAASASNFQIIMTDVNSFTSNIKPPRRKKKLARSSTTVNASSKVISKKSSLKRTLSQPQAKLGKTISSSQISSSQVVQGNPQTFSTTKNNSPSMSVSSLHHQRHPEAYTQQLRSMNAQHPHQIQNSPLQQRGLHHPPIPMNHALIPGHIQNNAQANPSRQPQVHSVQYTQISPYHELPQHILAPQIPDQHRQMHMEVPQAQVLVDNIFEDKNTDNVMDMGGESYF